MKPEELEALAAATRMVVYDTETTDMIAWNKPSHLKLQPHILQIAAQRCGDTQDPLDEMRPTYCQNQFLSRCPWWPFHLRSRHHSYPAQ